MATMTKRACSGVVGVLALLGSGVAWAESIELRTTATVSIGPFVAGTTSLIRHIVPAGTWSLHATATVATLESTEVVDVVYCALHSNDPFPVFTSGTLGASYPPATLPIDDHIVLTSPTPVSLICWQESLTSVVDTNATLVIERIGAPPALVDIVCTKPSEPDCLSGTVWVVSTGEPSPDAGVPDAGSPEDEATEESVPDDEALEEDPSEGACVEADGPALIEPCLGAELDPDRPPTRWDIDGILGRCPRRKPILWCTAFGYCWCRAA
jgi:hypothetical protein